MADQNFSPLMDEKTAALMFDPRPQRGPFKKKRAGVVLTRGEVKAIKIGRKRLRKELKQQGIRSRKEFDLTASSMGLYFDKNRFLGLIPLWFHGRILPMLLSALALLLTILYIYSTITELRGHFTINMNNDLFREGFVLSETWDFENPTMRLMCDPSADMPCVSILDVKAEAVEHDGKFDNPYYFAYTFYIRNEGESTVDYEWALNINSESKNLSTAVWAMVFEDDQMWFFAEEREDGFPEALPHFDVNDRGYPSAPMAEFAAAPDEQYELIAERGARKYYRLIPFPFESMSVVTSGIQRSVAPMDTHKYTVILWLEGDDPDCTDELIGGHLGMAMQFSLVENPNEV